MQTKGLSAVLFVVFLGFAPVAIGAEHIDGGWWNHLTESQKVAYVVGFFDGQTYTEKLFDGALLMGQADPETKKWNVDRARIINQAGNIAFKQLEHDFGSVTAGQLMAGLDKIYADYRNTRIEVREAMIVVVRSMDGTSDDEITKLLERKRKAAVP